MAVNFVINGMGLGFDLELPFQGGLGAEGVGVLHRRRAVLCNRAQEPCVVVYLCLLVPVLKIADGSSILCPIYRRHTNFSFSTLWCLREGERLYGGNSWVEPRAFRLSGNMVSSFRYRSTSLRRKTPPPRTTIGP